MKNFKKVLALVLAVATLLSFATVASATVNTSEMYSDADKIERIEAVDVLTAAGILNGKGGVYDAAATLTRAEAAKIVACFDNKADVAESYAAANTFSDVPANAWYTKYVAYCAKKNIISGVGDNKFAPDAKVTGIQFLKMMLGVLGYDQVEEGFVGNSWKVNVLKAAKDAGLLEVLGTKYDYDAQLNRDDAAQIMLNTLEAQTVVYGQDAQLKLYNVNKLADFIMRGEFEEFIEEGDYAGLAKLVTKNAKFVVTVAGAISTGEYLYEGWDLKSAKVYDAFERPSTEWKIKDGGKWTKIGTYPDVPTAVYTAKFYGCDAIADAGVVKEDDYRYFENGVYEGQISFDDNRNREYGYAGQTWEFYEDDSEDNGYRVVVIDTYLAQISKKPVTEKVDSRGHVTRKASVTADVFFGLGASEQTFETTGYEKDDFVLVNFSDKTNAIETMQPAEDKVMELTAKKADSYKIDGTYVNAAAKCYYDYSDFEDMIGDDVIVYFDQFGYIIGMERYYGELEYALVTALWVEGTKEPVLKADFFTFDGEEIEDVVVATLDGRDVEDIMDDVESTFDGEDWFLPWYYTTFFADSRYCEFNVYYRLFTVSENDDGEYDITSPLALDIVYASRYHFIDEASFKKGNRIVRYADNSSAFTMTDETLVVIYDAKKETYTAYEGYADLSTMENAQVEWIATEDNASKAEVVFILIGTASLSGEETTLFYAGGDWDKEFDEKKGGVKYYDYTFVAYVVNEDGTLSEEEFTINGTKEIENLFSMCFFTAFVDENNELQYNNFTNDIDVFGDWDYAVINDLDEMLVYDDNSETTLLATLIEGDIDAIYVVNDDENGLDEFSFEDIETGDKVIGWYQTDNEVQTIIVKQAD